MLLFIAPHDLEYIYTCYLRIVSETLLYFKNFAFYICLWIVGYVFLCCVVYLRYARRAPAKIRDIKRVLVAVAHPDDECMFFGPTIIRLCEQGVEVHLLCLSNGNFEGKGHLRREELWKACKELGIPDQNICLINDTRLKDQPTTQWPVPVVAKLIQYYLEMLDIDTLVTFDRGGVSSHANHSSLFYALAYLFVEKLMPSRCTAYTLDSVNLLRKYWGILDLPLSFMLSSNSIYQNKTLLSETARAMTKQLFNFRYFLLWTESRRVVRAMKQHRSQMVWFRHLYVAFSRYMFINTLRRISLVDIELELEVDD